MSELDPAAQGADAGAGADAAESAAGFDRLAAALRRDAADLETYARVLTTSLADALPADAVAVERRRTMGDRLAGREGRVERLDITLDGKRLALTASHGRPQGELVTVVRGVVLSRTPVPLDVWAAELAAAVSRRARSDARARAALERLALGD